MNKLKSNVKRSKMGWLLLNLVQCSFFVLLVVVDVYRWTECFFILSLTRSIHSSVVQTKCFFRCMHFGSCTFRKLTWFGSLIFHWFVFSQNGVYVWVCIVCRSLVKTFGHEQVFTCHSIVCCLLSPISSPIVLALSCLHECGCCWFSVFGMCVNFEIGNNKTQDTKQTKR